MKFAELRALQNRNHASRHRIVVDRGVENAHVLNFPVGMNFELQIHFSGEIRIVFQPLRPAVQKLRLVLLNDGALISTLLRVFSHSPGFDSCVKGRSGRLGKARLIRRLRIHIRRFHRLALDLQLNDRRG